MTERTITSKTNERIKHVRKLLADRKYRYEQGEYVIEGLRVLDSLRTAKEVFVLEGISSPVRSERTYILPEQVFKEITATETSQGIIVVAPLRMLGPDSLLKTERYVLLDGIQDPGNMGTILRTACAFGMKGAILTPGSVDPFSPKVVRAAASSIEKLDLISIESADVLKGFHLIGAALRGSDLSTFSWPENFILAVGSEATGLSKEVQTAAESLVSIPMTGEMESLNAAVSAGIILYSATRQ